MLGNAVLNMEKKLKILQQNRSIAVTGFGTTKSHSLTNQILNII